MYGAVTWTLREVDQKYFVSLEMWCWRLDVKHQLDGTDRVKNEEVLRRINEEMNALHAIK